MRRGLLAWSNPLDCVRLSSIGSEIELTQIRPFDFVRLPNSIALNKRIEYDWVRLSSISERLICYAGNFVHLSLILLLFAKLVDGLKYSIGESRKQSVETLNG